VKATDVKPGNAHVQVDLGVYGVELLTFGANGQTLNY
jgi:hypothetical protein